MRSRNLFRFFVFGTALVLLRPAAWSQCPTPVFGQDKKITSFTGNPQGDPDLIVDPYYRPMGLGTVYAVWHEFFDHVKMWDIQFSSSTSGGATWSPARTLNSNPSGSQLHPAIGVDQFCSANGTIWVVWVDFDAPVTGDRRIMVTTSSDRGVTWSPEVPVHPQALPPSDQDHPRVSVKDNTAFIAWQEQTPAASNNLDILFTCLSLPITPAPIVITVNNTPPQRLLFAVDVDAAWSSSVSTVDRVHVAWDERALNPNNILFNSSSAPCAAWGSETPVPQNGGSLPRLWPALESFGTRVWMTYEDRNWFQGQAFAIIHQQLPTIGLPWTPEIKVDPTHTSGSFDQIGSDITMTFPFLGDPALCGTVLGDETPKLYAGWLEDRAQPFSGTRNFAVTCSSNNGTSWSNPPNTQINDVVNKVMPLRASLAGDIFSDVVYAAWGDTRDPSGVPQIWVDVGQ